jgi:hypothetical protein
MDLHLAWRQLGGPSQRTATFSLGLLLASALASAAETRLGDYVFSLERGELGPISPVFGDPGHPKPGDVLQWG